MNRELLFLASYLIGSIPTGYWLVWLVKKTDVRRHGSGNIGMTNVWRVAGAPWGLLTLLLDIAKGVLVVWLSRHFFPQQVWIPLEAAFAVLVGNVFTVFLKFKGGKGIGVSVGVFFSLLPLESALGAAAFAAAVGFTRMISAGSLCAVTIMTATAFFFEGFCPTACFALLAGILVWWTHRENIKRILRGTENRLGRKKSGDPK
ncbi:MAG: glycerol-3-phosphate 1-O-acyltransferase PlsY [bacterium]